MKTMTEKSKQPNWVQTIASAAREKGLELPPLIPQAMGVARSEPGANSRFVTLKRRLVPASEALQDGMEWTLWTLVGDLPQAEVVFRQPLYPDSEAVAFVLSILQGWLLDNRTADEVRNVVAVGA